MMKLTCSLTTKAFGLTLVLTAMASVAFAQRTAPVAPEMDAGSAATALTLLVGGAMLLKDRLFSK